MTKKAGCLDFSLASRRDFLRVGSLGLLGVSLPRYLQFESLMAGAGVDIRKTATAKSVIVLWLEGGPSHVDTFDPKPNSSFRPISTNVPGIQVSELCPKIARQMDKLAIVRSVRTEENNHLEAAHQALTGHRPGPAMEFPSFGSIITKELGPRNSMPPHILAPQFDVDRQYETLFKSAFLGAEYDPLILSDPTGCSAADIDTVCDPDFQIADLSLPKGLPVERVESRLSLLKMVDSIYRRKVELAEFSDMDTFREQALDMILAPDVREAFDLSRESEKTRDAYGRNGFGQSVLLARRLIEKGSRFVTAAGYKFNEWDTHGRNDKQHRDHLVPPLDQALPTLLVDLEQRGLLESTLVITMGEFGRTPHLNAGGGRDHWANCWSLLMAGGGIPGGRVIGASDELGAHPAEQEVSMGDVIATVYKALGIDWTKEYMTPIGRPVKIANSFEDKTGKPIKGLI